MNSRNRIIISVATLMVGLGIAASTVTLLLKGERSYLEKIRSAEIRRNISIDETLSAAEQAVERGDELSFQYEQLSALDPRHMTEEQNLRYNLLWGDLYLDRFRRTGDPKARQIFFDRGMKQYDIAARLTSSSELRGGLYRRIARMNVENHNWTMALELYRRAYPLIGSPRERWNTDLEMADCHIMLNQIGPAMDLINLAAGSDDQDVACRALLEKADIIVRAMTDETLEKEMTGYFLDIDAVDFQPYITNKEPLRYFEKTAKNIFEQVSARLPNVNPLHSRAQLGLLRLAVMNLDADAAYYLGNRLLSGAAGKMDMVRAVLDLAELEKRRRDYDAAINLIQRVLEKYPVEAASQKAGLELYNLYKEVKDWDAAFSVARGLFQSTSDPTGISRLVQDFSSGDSQVFDVIVNSPDKEYYIAQMQYIFRRLESKHPEEWQKIRIDGHYLLAQLYFAANDLAKAQERLNTCFLLADRQGIELDERFLRLDLLCALKDDASPVVVASRARRYLSAFPRGEYYRSALLELLRRYFRMGLYEPALSVSRLIYADELDSAGSGIERDQIWLETIAIIAQCYFRLGQGEVANRLIRNFSQDILRKDYAGDIYYAWAEMAIEKNQLYEAARRINVALLYTSDPGEKLKLKVAQCLLFLNTGSLKDFYEASALIRALDEDTSIMPQKRFELRRRLFESMLSFAFEQNMIKEFDAVFQAALRREGSAPWLQFWLLRSLSPYFNLESLQELGVKHEELLIKGKEILSDKESFEFINAQLSLIKDLINIENRYEELKKAQEAKL